MKTIRWLLALAILVGASPGLSAQQKAPLDHDAYAIWKQIQDEDFSRDGRWLVYRLVPGDGDATLVVESLEDGRRVTVPRGADPGFTADTRFLVALVEPAEAAVDAARAGGSRDAPGDSLLILNLSDLSETRVAEVRSFRLPGEDGSWMAYLMEESADGGEEEEEAEEAAGAEEDDGGEGPPRLEDGTTLVVRDLATGQERRFDHAVSYAFSGSGGALYYTASGEDGAADGVFRVGPDGGAETVTGGEGRYLRLAVADDGAVAFLTDRDDRGAGAPAFALYAAREGTATSRVAPGAEALPADWAPSEHGEVSFSGSGARVLFHSAPRPLPDPEDDTPEDERVQVDIWNWKDPLLQPMQLVQLEDELERSYQAVLDLGSGRAAQLATTEVPDVTVADDGDGAVAMGRSDLPYRQLVSWDASYVDLYTIDVADGSRRQVAERVRGQGTLSPGGGYITRWDGVRRIWVAIDTGSGEEIDLTGSIDAGFYNVLDDRPDLARSYGTAGWTEDDAAFLVYDRYDIWAVDPTGRAAPRNLTRGAGRASDTRFRYVDLDTADPAVPSGEVYLSSFHLYDKSSGLWRGDFDAGAAPEQLIAGDARYAGLFRAQNAEVFAYTRSTFEEFPDLWVAGPALDDGRKVTDANPQQSDYLWGTAEIVEWTSMDGIPLQGILYKPEGFDPSEQHPMMVYFYERSSDGLHGYAAPAPGSSSINRSFYVSRGYLLFVPDIPYRDGYPGESALDAVVPGVLELVEAGFVDANRIGVQGHSWGGYQIAYMVTRTDLFAAAEAGAPVSNMISAYGGIRWQSGRSRAVQYERGQSRIGGSLWEYPLRFIENSPIFTADKINTPILMLHNDEDGAVPWYQGIELFVALRRLGKPVWMLNYNGEAHGLRQRHNQKDWAIRMQQFFDHYLKGAPAPVWMEEGVPAIMKGRTLGLELTRVRAISEEEEGRSPGAG